MAGVGVAFSLGALDDRLYEREEVEQLGLAPVLVEVPAVGKPARGKGTGARAAASPASPLARREEAAGAAGPVTATGSEGGRATPSPDTPTATEAPSHGTGTAMATTGAAPGASSSGQALMVGEPGHAGAGDPSVLVRSVRVETRPGDDPRLLMLAAPTSPAAASFRVLRHRLAERRAAGVLLVTSPVAGEGRTFCATNLALALGEAWQARVLLLEAHLRGPALAKLMGFVPPACIARQLETFRNTGAHYWEVAQTIVPWLHTAAVDPEGTSSDELDGPSILFCVGDLRRAGYDFIVVDGPPVLGSADANLLEQCADGVLVVLRAGRSRARDFRRAVEQLGTSRILGVVWLTS
jgi:Mrp family chromosome partitioning ATPase